MGRRLVGWAGELLITLGVLLLLFTAWQLWWTDVVANRASAQLVEQLRDDFAKRGAQEDPSTPDHDPARELPGDAFALMTVPRFGEDWVQPVLQGTDLDVLSRGVGHYVGTAMPGSVGNFSVAAHRTTWGAPFHDIDTLRDGDLIRVETLDTEYTYRVTAHEVVLPGDVAVVASVPDDPGATPVDRLMTLTSCHPKYSATERYVVHAAYLSSRPLTRPGDGVGDREPAPNPTPTPSPTRST